MKFSFFMMPLHHPSENPSLAFERDIALIRLADELDFDEFFIGEHHSGGWETMPCPEMALARASAHAHRIRLGTSVVGLPYHHPFHVAERIAFLDHLTRGRAILGVGPSSLVTDIKLFGLPPGEHRAITDESLDIIVRLLESPEPFDYEGKYWKLRDVRLQLRSYQQPRLPLAIATAGSPHAMELAGRYGMILFSSAGKPVGGKHALAEHWPLVEASAARHGVAVSREDWRVVTFVYLAETRERAWADAEAAIRRDMGYFITIGNKPVYEAYPGQPLGEITPRSAAEVRRWIIGTPDDAVAAVERFQEETGGFGGLMLTTHEWVEPAKAGRSLELFARYVMPRFRGHTRDLQDEWKRTEAASAAGRLPLPGQPAPIGAGHSGSNLSFS
ncbi:MAG: LLM class flavin-dependent oxidoreductase [Nitrospinota bacterium]